MRTAAEVQASVVELYEAHPFPSIEDKRAKVAAEMPIRLRLLGIGPGDYVGRRVLDAGCGTGEYACWYASQGSDVTAVDLSAPSLGRAREYAAGQGLENVRFQKQSVLALDFPDASFDYVYSMGVLHHTPDPYGGFRELCRVLRPGGVIVVSLYNRWSRLPHNVKQAVVRGIAGSDPDRRVAWAKRLFPRTCRALQRNRGNDSGAILYDAFAIPHESRHSVGELLRWFDDNRVDYLGAFGPVTLRDNLLALALMRRREHGDFQGYFQGYPLASWATSVLPRLAEQLGGIEPGEPRHFRRPSRASRAVVQLAWTLLGFRFSIFSLSGRKPARPTSA
jgi:SAM-dependent methyltransferase